MTHIARFLIYLVGMLPLGVARGLGKLLGVLSWWAQDRGAVVTQENLQLCFPEMDEVARQRLARASLQETYKIAGEMFVLWRRGKAWLQQVTHKRFGEESITTAIQNGQGVLVAIPHLGNWEVLGAHLSAYAKPTCMYRPPKTPWLEDLIVEKRESMGMTLVPTDRSGVAAQLKALKSGELVAILPDQVPPVDSGNNSPFFGHEAHTMTLVHSFIKRTGCKVVMGFAKRVPDGFDLHYLEPPAGIYSEDQATSLEALNKAVENCVLICKEQYQWEYKRFRRGRLGRRRAQR